MWTCPASPLSQRSYSLVGNYCDQCGRGKVERRADQIRNENTEPVQRYYDRCYSNSQNTVDLTANTLKHATPDTF